ncbi:MAG: proton-conducting transporter membrane subunit [Verrucomicrobiota bacterium]|jgi:multicomponent Na+:H+ antiporter subunit D|nr:proton-conducting transporter membrane subunit [Verrucomicrobiota bacterium]
MTEQLPIVIILGPLLAAILSSFTAWYRPKASHPLVVIGLAVSFAAALKLVLTVARDGAKKYWLGGWGNQQHEFVVGIQITVDHLNTLLLAAVSGIALLTALYAKRLVDIELAGRQRYFYALFSLLVTGLLGIAITGDIFNLYVFMEIAALSSYALIAYGKGRAYMAAFNYLIMGTMGACLYLLGVGFVFVKTGTLNVDDVSALLPTLAQAQAVFVGFVLILLGAWAKMAFFPFHGWLPNAYTYAPTASAVVLAPLATKVAVYAMLRIMVTVYSIGYVLNSPNIQSVVLALSSIAIVAGSFYSLTQTSLKMIACYVVLSEIGYMVGGAWLANEPGLTGAMYHVVADAVMTSALFMVVGCIVYRLGQAQLEDLQAVFFKMPVTMAAFVVTMAALIGVPPTCGFFSKWYLIQGATQAGTWHFVAALLLSSLVKAIILFRIVEIGYNRVPHPAVEGNPVIPRNEAPLSMLIPTVVMALALIVLGLATDPLVDSIIAKALPTTLAP